MRADAVCISPNPHTMNTPDPSHERTSVSRMQVQRAVVADAQRISSLICSLSAPFFLSSCGEGAEPFLASVGESATRRYIVASNFNYLVAKSAGQLAGVIAVRDNNHLFHLFIATAFQGKGLARELWQLAKANAVQAGNPGRFTVNSSLGAVPIYERFGFVPSGPRVEQNGIAFQPMSLIEPPVSKAIQTLGNSMHRVQRGA